MNQPEIWRASAAELKRRLALAPAREAALIRNELARRAGCCVQPVEEVGEPMNMHGQVLACDEGGWPAGWQSWGECSPTPAAAEPISRRSAYAAARVLYFAAILLLACGALAGAIHAQ